MPLYWYALRSKPRKEDAARRQAMAQGFEVYYPWVKVQRVNPRSRPLAPYLPGYLFVRADLDDVGVSIFQWMPYTLGLVEFGGEPAVVPDNLVVALQKRVTEINQAGGELFDGLHPGERVAISGGAFDGYEAIFDARLPGTERVRVLLEFLGNRRQVAVIIDAHQIERKKAKKH